MVNRLRIRESVSFSFLSDNWLKVKDDFQNSTQPNKGILIPIAATHAGIITRNNGFYLPDRMRSGATSFVKDYQKPILLHHEEHKDPIGRIVDSNYVDTSGSIFDQLKDNDKIDRTKITDNLIKDFVSDKMPFAQKVDVVRSILRDSNLLEDEGYQGLGFIKIIAHITDPKAIEKVLDGRYITGSVGATTNKAVCSVCREDWTETGGECGHRPGGIYDKVKCFIIAGDLIYDEYSFVNVPADRHSRILQLDYNGKQIDIETISDFTGRTYEMLLEPTRKEESEMGKKIEDKKTEDSTVKVVDEVKTEPTTTVTSTTEEVVTDKKETDKPEEESIENLFNRVMENSDITLTDEEEEKLYNLLWAEVEDMNKSGLISDEVVKDAKLSTKKRKALPKSSFCGPDKSFPVNDCAHVTAARRLVNKYKGPGDKTKILACVARKAKAMGCDSGKKSKDSTNVKDDLSSSRMLRMVLSVLDEDTYYTQNPVLDDDEKKMLQSIIKRMASLVGKDMFVFSLLNEEVIKDESVLLGEVEKLEDTIGELRDRLDASLKEHNILFQEFEELNDSLVLEKTETRKIKEQYLEVLSTLVDGKVSDKKFDDISSDDLDLEITKTFEIVDMKKITDRLGDGLSRTPTEKVDDPTVVSDNQNISPEVKEKVERQYWYLAGTGGRDIADKYLAQQKELGNYPVGK